jgi:D-glycero-D-manno-heptose 1,7-bisphosphate phosphatase
MRRAVFLDRDGVLNEPVVVDGKPYPPTSPDEVVLCDGAAAALGSLRAAGFALICVTNQPDVARGTLARATVDAINERIGAALALDEILVCDHDDADACACRKPLPGLIVEGAQRHGIDISASYLVGDRWRDIEAGDAAGCRTVWLDRGYAERAPHRGPDVRVGSIVEAAQWILSHA